MIIGLGIDAVKVNRFNYFANQIPRFLARLSSLQESSLSRIQLAGNFAASEALLKACPSKYLDLVSKVEFLRGPNGEPTSILYDFNEMPISFFNVYISITNLDDIVIAAVILEQKHDTKQPFM